MRSKFILLWEPMERTELQNLFQAKRWDAVASRAATHPHEVRSNLKILGMCALHNQPPRVLKALIEAFPEGASMLHGSKPSILGIMCSTNQRGIESILEKEHSTSSLGRRDTSCLLQDEDGSIANLWEKACLLIQAIYRPSSFGHKTGPIGPQPKSEIRRENRRTLHACAGIECPPEMLRLAAKLHPEQLIELDQDGNCPLHIAAAKPATSGSQGVIELLIWGGIDTDEGPTALRIRNKRQKLPFQVAVENGRAWSDGGLRSILEAYPGAVASHALHDGSYPIILALIGREGALSTLFDVLREKPDLMRM